MHARARVERQSRERGAKIEGGSPKGKTFRTSHVSRLLVTCVFIYVSRAFRSWCCDELSDRLFGLQDSAMFELESL